MAEQVDDLQAPCSAIGATPAHLVGHSYGAYLCLLLAIRRPASVRSLVLVEPPVLPLFADIPPKPSQVARLLVSRPRTAIAIMTFAATGFTPAAAAARRGDAERSMHIFGRAMLGGEAYRRLSPQRRQQVRVNTRGMDGDRRVACAAGLSRTGGRCARVQPVPRARIEAGA